MPNCSEEGGDRSSNCASGRCNANLSDACPPTSFAGTEFESPVRKYHSSDVYGNKFTEDSLNRCDTDSVQSEPANFYSSAVIVRVNEFSGRSPPPRSSALAEYSFVSTRVVGKGAPDFSSQYGSHTPGCKNYEEISATVELAEEVDDDNLYGSYAETDLDNLDQTTDFSQKYKEHFDSYRSYDSSQLDEADNLESFPFPNEEGASPFHQDTVKVYCTEGTPLFISTASSLTDLREIGESGGVGVQKSRRRSLREPKEGQIEESEGESFNSDTAAAEQNSGPTCVEKGQPGSSLRVPSIKEGKTVTFGEQISLADETPLMFSRSSSLGSLSSFDQQGTQDDRLTVGSFSQQTSGNISPSDLPDSPSETMPPSPRRPSRHATFHLPPCVRPLPPPVDCVFREVPQSFAEEGTPCRISQATSLSSLAVDDEQCINEEICAPRQSVSGDVFNDIKHQFAEEGTPCLISRAESLSPLPLGGVHADDDGNASAILRRQFANVDEVIGGNRTEQEGSTRAHSFRSENLTMGNGHSCGMPLETKQKHELPPLDMGNKSRSVTSHGHVEIADGHQRRCHDKFGIQTANEPTEKFFGDSHTHFEQEKFPCGYPRAVSGCLTFSDDHKPALLQEQSLILERATPCAAEGKNREGSVAPEHTGKHVTFSGSYTSPPPQFEPPTFADDSTRVYCTEDTPANLSHAASYSDLSSISGERSVHVSDDWCNGSDDNSSDILMECIQLGKSAAMKNGSAKKVPGNVMDTKLESSGSSQDTYQPPVFERDFAVMRLSSPACDVPSVANQPQDVPPGTENILDSVHAGPLGSNFGGSAASSRNEKDAGFGRPSLSPSRKTGLADVGDAIVKNAEEGVKLEGVGSSSNVDSSSSKSLSGRLELSDDDDVDDSEILAEVIRLGMPKSDSPARCVSSSARVATVMPRVVQSKGSHRVASEESSDDEANDRRLLEEVINLGRQQLKLSSSSISKGIGEEGHLSRPRTKDRRADLQSSKPRVRNVSHDGAPLQCGTQSQRVSQFDRARSSESRNGHAVRRRKQNPVHYERSASEKRQRPLAFLQSSVGFMSDCEEPELRRGQKYSFKQGTDLYWNDTLHQKPFFALGGPLPTARNQVRACHERYRKLGSTAVKSNECHVPPSQPVKCKLPPKPPSKQLMQPAPFTKFDCDSENEIDDVKLLREVIMLGTSGLSNVSPKIPILRKQAKPSSSSATLDATASSTTNRESSSTDDEALLQEVIQLGKSKVLAASKTSSTAPKCSLSKTESSSLKGDSTSCNVTDSSRIGETQARPNADLSATVAPEDVPGVLEFCRDKSPLSIPKPVDACDTEGETGRIEGCTKEYNLAGSNAPLMQGSASDQAGVQLKETKTLPQIAPALLAKAKRQAPANEVTERRESGAPTETNASREKEQLAMPAEPPADSLERVTAIRIKLPDGRALTRRFMATWELRVLLTFLSYLGYPIEKFKIIKNWRRQELSTSNPQQTLEQLKLYPKKTLTIKER